MNLTDVQRSAQLLVDEHGVVAVDLACTRLRELSTEGDLDGCAVWARILAAVNELQRTARREGEAVN